MVGQAGKQQEGADKEEQDGNRPGADLSSVRVGNRPWRMLLIHTHPIHERKGKRIIIIVEGGMVQEVRGLPSDCDYEVDDRDVDKKG